MTDGCIPLDERKLVATLFFRDSAFQPSRSTEMPLWGLKCSLAILLGSMSFGLFIILELQNDIIRLEIYWKASYPSYADHPDAIGVKPSGHSDTATSINATDVLPKSPELNKDTLHQYSEESKHLQKTDTGLLSRGVRQVPPVPEGQLSSSSITTKASSKKSTKVDHSENGRLSKTEKVPKSMVPVEQALSKTAPDWVGSTIPPIDIADIKCADTICTEYLSEVDRDQFKMCMQRTVTKKDRIGPILPNVRVTCRFQNGTYRHPVALASFPGSGNTWMRGLLQKTTGICTGVWMCNPIVSQFISLRLSNSKTGMGGFFRPRLYDSLVNVASSSGHSQFSMLRCTHSCFLACDIDYWEWPGDEDVGSN